MIDGRNLFDQPVKNDTITVEKLELVKAAIIMQLVVY